MERSENEIDCGKCLYTAWYGRILIPANFDIAEGSCLLPSKLLHGTRSAPFDRFDITQAQPHAPFGPAIYLTADPLVAQCYFRPGGGICEVELSGESVGILDLNCHILDQPELTRSIVLSMLVSLGIKATADIGDTRAVVELADKKLGKKLRNRLLVSVGIWMLHGHLNSMEHSGLCDRGRQFAVLDPSRIVGLRWNAVNAEN